MTFKVFSLGCKVNSYECSALSSLLIAKGYALSDDDNPDVFIINTCSVTATADQKSRQHIRKFMNMYPNAIMVVMGCYSQGNWEYISKEINPHIIVGTSNKNKIPELIDEYLKTKRHVVLVDDDTRKLAYEEFVITACSENTRAYLKIEDGCNNFCTYCLIPYRRGRLRSRLKEDVIKEACELIRLGYSEIVLTGIDVGGYGQDLDGYSFSKLVEDLLKLPNLKSLRISSIEASQIDDHLISLFAKYPNLAHHLHIPLQSGSAHVLKLMNRKYQKDEFLSKINKVKELVPDIALSSDVIVGFPQESDEDFLETYEFIKECGFHQLHVFPFSPRKGTGAYLMKGQIPSDVKKKRCSSLLALSKELWGEYTNRFIGKTLKALVEKKYKDGYIVRTSNYIALYVSSKEEKIGSYIDVKIEKSMITSQ